MMSRWKLVRRWNLDRFDPRKSINFNAGCRSEPQVFEYLKYLAFWAIKLGASRVRFVWDTLSVPSCLRVLLEVPLGTATFCGSEWNTSDFLISRPPMEIAPSAVDWLETHPVPAEIGEVLQAILSKLARQGDHTRLQIVCEGSQTTWKVVACAAGEHEMQRESKAD